jgi:hypothetical protein
MDYEQSQYTEDDAAFVEAIRNAFADVEYPGDDQLIIFGERESTAMAEAFRGRHWSEVTFPLLLRYRLDLALFTPQGFRFYLPAFLIAMLTECDGRDLAFFLYCALIPPDSGDEVVMERFKARLAVFTAAQQAMIDQFIMRYEDIDENAKYTEGNEFLVREAYRAFADVEYPGDDHIVIRRGDHTSEEIIEDFQGKHWKEVSTSVLNRYRLYLYHFAPRGFYFYFPAFLIAVLTNGDASDISDYLAYKLMPPDPNDEIDHEWSAQYFNSLLGKFTPAQLEVAKKYVFYILKGSYLRNAEKERVEQFWSSVQK